jgi:mono/diheme cytochrome c family protein
MDSFANSHRPRPVRARRVGAILSFLLWGGTADVSLWAEPRPPHFPALDLGIPGLAAGEVLLAELDCTACHAAAPAVLDRLRPKPAPRLGQVASRLDSTHARAWLLDPLTVKPGTTMPAVLHRLPPAQREAAADDLVHFLWSLGGEPTPPPAPGAASSFQWQQGRVLYHQIGCVACHPPYEGPRALFGLAGGGPSDPDAIQYVLRQLQDSSQPLPNLAAKYKPAGLVRFLLDPLEVRPGGRMPALNLTEAEARALTVYLQTEHAKASAEPPPTPGWIVDPTKAKRGRTLFADVGCAACHDLGPGLTPIRSSLQAKPLDKLDPEVASGCLGTTPPPTAPRYALSPAQRAALQEALRPPDRWRTPPTPAERVGHTLAALNCYACHSRDALGGPGASRSDFFQTLSDYDLGDEGRLPPHLSGVGHKLRSEWLGEVLTNAGAVRPYMGVRMPQFGQANIGQLAAGLRAADARSGAGDPAPPGEVQAGAELVGIHGYACIQCHRFGPLPSLGISIMDLTRMTQRLHWDWFRRYLENPGLLRVGTRMPAFWPEGQASVTDILEGDTARQIASIWAYLSLAAEAPPPPGLVENLEHATGHPPTGYE